MASGYSDMTLISEDKGETQEGEGGEEEGGTGEKTAVDSDQVKIAILFESGLFLFWETVVFKMFNVDEVVRNTSVW